MWKAAGSARTERDAMTAVHWAALIFIVTLAGVAVYLEVRARR